MGRFKTPEKVIENGLRSLKIPQKELPSDFALSLHHKLEEAKKDFVVEKNYFGASLFKHLAFGLSFTVIFVLGLWTGMHYTSTKPAILPETANESLVTTDTQVKTGEPVTIKLVYNSPKDIENVSFAIMLQDGLSFVSDDESVTSVRVLKWEGRLQKGKNEIPFVVQAADTGAFRINAIAEYAGGKHMHDIKLSVKSEEKEGGHV